MSWLAILGLVISGASSLLNQLNSKYAGVGGSIAADIAAAIAALSSAQNKAATLAEFESLRTTKEW